MSRKREYRKPGPESSLNADVFKLIREATLKGLTLAETAKFAQMNVDTFYVYHSDNYLNLADKIKIWKLDRKLALAEGNIEEILQMPIKDSFITKDGDLIVKDDVGKLKVKADMSKFVAQTLGRADYAQRQEITGKDGSDLKIDVNDKELIGVIKDFENKLKEKLANVQQDKDNVKDSQAGR
jgi:hypothetical protein